MYSVTEFNQGDRIYLLKNYVPRFSEILTELSSDISKDPKLAGYDSLYCSIMVALWGAISELAITCKNSDELHEVNTAALSSIVETSYLAYNLYNNEPEIEEDNSIENEPVKILNDIKITDGETIIPDGAEEAIEDKLNNDNIVPFIDLDNDTEDIEDDSIDKIEVISHSVVIEDDGDD